MINIPIAQKVLDNYCGVRFDTTVGCSPTLCFIDDTFEDVNPTNLADHVSTDGKEWTQTLGSRSLPMSGNGMIITSYYSIPYDASRYVTPYGSSGIYYSTSPISHAWVEAQQDVIITAHIGFASAVVSFSFRSDGALIIGSEYEVPTGFHVVIGRYLHYKSLSLWYSDTMIEMLDYSDVSGVYSYCDVVITVSGSSVSIEVSGEAIPVSGPPVAFTLSGSYNALNPGLGNKAGFMFSYPLGTVSSESQQEMVRAISICPN